MELGNNIAQWANGARIWLENIIILTLPKNRPDLLSFLDLPNVDDYP